MKRILPVFVLFTISAGVKSQQLDTIMLRKMEAAIGEGRYPNTHSILVAIDSKLVYEHYWAGPDKKYKNDYRELLDTLEHGIDSLHDAQSITKGIVSACVGIAISQGKIRGVNQRIFDFFPGYNSMDTGVKAAITIKDLLTMTSGLQWNEEDYRSPANSEHLMDSAADPVSYVLSLPVEASPGKTFNYCGGAPQILAAIIQKATGKTIVDFATQFLFKPLGIKHFKWVNCSNSKVPNAFDGLYLSSRDMLQFGLLYLHDGIWNSHRILGSDWVKSSLSPQIYIDRAHNASFGYLWWLAAPTIGNKPVKVAACIGNGGQRIVVDKAHKMVIVITAGNYRKQAYSDEIIQDFIYPALLKATNIAELVH